MLRICRPLPQDIHAVSELFLTSFPESMQYIFDGKPPLVAVESIFLFILESEPKSFWLARHGHEIVGYVIAPKNMRRLWLAALTGGYLFRWAYQFLSGRFPISLRALGIVSLNKLLFVLSPYNYPPSPTAQILSIAVSQKMTRRGVGEKLLQQALWYLADEGIHEVKLEVRPDNTPARRLYDKMGFTPIGKTRDSQGEWLVMAKRLSPDKSPHQHR